MKSERRTVTCCNVQSAPDGTMLDTPIPRRVARTGGAKNEARAVTAAVIAAAVYRMSVVSVAAAGVVQVTATLPQKQPFMFFIVRQPEFHKIKISLKMICNFL